MTRSFAGAAVVALLLAGALASAQRARSQIPPPSINVQDVDVTARRLAPAALALFLVRPTGHVEPVVQGPPAGRWREAIVLQLVSAYRRPPLVSGRAGLRTSATAQGTLLLTVTPADESRLEFEVLGGGYVIIPDLRHPNRHAAFGLSRHTGRSASLLESVGAALFRDPPRAAPESGSARSDSLRSLTGSSAAWCSPGFVASCTMIAGDPLCLCRRVRGPVR